LGFPTGWSFNKAPTLFWRHQPAINDVNNCCTISTIHVPSNDDMFINEHILEDSYSIAYDDYNDEYDIFSYLPLRRKLVMIKICLLYLMTMVMRIMIAILLNLLPLRLRRMTTFMWRVMHMAHDKNVLCDSYIVNFIHDATESYYKRGKHGFMHLNNIKFPLSMLKILKLHLFCFPMLIALRFHDLFLYKILFHRKWFRLKIVLYLLFDTLLPQALFWRLHEHLLKSLCKS
jgi:hypothetical protein